MKNKKSFFGGLGTGFLICAVIMGLLACSGSGKNVAQNETAETSQEEETESSSSSSSGQDAIPDISSDYKDIESKLNMLKTYLQMYYMPVDDTEITADDIEAGIYKGYVSSLGDPYTVYYTKEEYESLEESMQGNYSGIGVLLQQDADTYQITVIRVFEGSPAESAGLMKDDVLVKVNGEDISQTDLNEVVSNVRGEPGSTVDITIYRPSEGKYYDLTVERQTIETQLVEYEMMEDNIGVIHIYEFEETTASQFQEALDDLESQGAQGLIIDLRDNPGGLVNSATDILDILLPSDKLLVYTVDKSGNKDEVYSKDDDEVDIPMVVLMNENSASASEITAGCLQDYGTELVGTTSYGKGIVQYVFQLDDGSAIKVTSAKYYSPEGRNIHGTGLSPDIEVEDDPDTEEDEQLNAAHEEVLQQINGE